MALNVLDLIIAIEKRPEMYISHLSINCLRVYLDGYSAALGEKEASEFTRPLKEFREWIAQKHGISSNQSWDRIVLFYSANEARALDDFFILFNEFMNGNE